ncbi:MAG: hypothetical protein GXO25_00035 [Euryarchaeota archaeon]|nr:hypothetical protein [Euryarchaeota archaeon]
MNAKKEFMLCECGWDALANMTKKPEMILELFPYCKGYRMEGDKIFVEFDVKKFLLNFKFEFALKVDINFPYIRYVFTGKKGTLTITFYLDERTSELSIEAAWKGFGERLMDKQLEDFAQGIKDVIAQIRDQYLNTQYLIKDTTRGGAKVRDVSPLKMPAIIKYFYAVANDRSFVILGSGEHGDFFRTTVENGVVKGCVYIKGGEKYTLKINKRVMDLEWTDFKDMKPKGDYFLKIEE